MDAIRDLLYNSTDVHQRIDALETATREYYGLLGGGPKNTLKEDLSKMYDKGWHSGWSTGYDTANSRPSPPPYSDYRGGY